VWDLPAILLLYLVFRFKNPQVLAQNGFSVQKSKQKADENTNPKGILTRGRKRREAAAPDCQH